MRSGGGANGARELARPTGHDAYPARRGQAPSAAEIGALFRDLRRILRLSLPDLAVRLGTRIEVVTALERGEIGRLPPWPETVRVVTGYTSLARIDPRPVLAIIRNQMEGGATVVRVGDGAPNRLRSLARAASAAAGRVASTTRSAASVAWGARQAMAQNWIASETADMDFEAGARHSMAWLGRTGILVLLVVSLTLATYLARSTGLEGAFANLRTPIVRLVDKAQDYVARRLASSGQSSDDLKWVDVDDPRSRRADRLKTDPR
jgi:transcriptional regulator with XRE-family HTH domain